MNTQELSNTSSWEVITHWNLPYQHYLELLNTKKKDLLENPYKRHIIICSHPRVFTHGRGLRNLKGGPELISLHKDQENILPYPLFTINRGGGLTFHYPGQIIIYPLVNLNTFPKALMTLMHLLLITIGDTLQEMNYLTSYHIRKDIYGLWHEDKKIASIGMGLDRYITEHGLALNFFHDQEIFEALNSVYPCGISAQIYSSVQKINSNLNENDRALFVEQFTSNFLKKFST